MSNDTLTTQVLRLGKAQIDAMFQRVDQHAIDDSEFIPLLEVVLNAFETAGVEQSAVEELWQHAYLAYDSACREAEPDSPFEENKELMQRYLLGPRKLAPKRKRGRR
jgi:hypothetical protein